MKRSLLFLFVPFRDEVREIHDNKKFTIDQLFEKHFTRIQDQRQEFEPHRTLLLSIEEALSDPNVLEEEDGEDEEDGEHFIPEESTTESEIKDFLKEAKKARVNANPKVDIAALPELREHIRCLNKGQRQVFDDVVERLWSPEAEKKPFYMYISGEAGTGKSYVLRTIVEAAKLLFWKSGLPLDRPTTQVLCPTATSANIVGGKTIESALRLFTFDNSSTPAINFSDKGMLQHHYEFLNLIVIDEASMVGGRKFQQMHNRFVDLKGKSPYGPFGGVSVIAIGDFRQLPPVKDKYLFANTNLDGRPQNLAVNWWKTHFKMYSLSEKMRSLDDKDFASVCDSVGRGEVNNLIINYFEERIQVYEGANRNEEFQSGRLAIITADNAKVSNLNKDKLESLLPDEIKHTFWAEDKFKNLDENPPLSLLISKPYTQTGRLITMLTVAKNAPAMITMNLDTNDFLTNGIRGWIVAIEEEKKIIWMKFDDPKVGRMRRRKSKEKFPEDETAVPIRREKASFSFGNTGSTVRVQRTQYPIVVCYALTAHKSQGMTIPKVIIDFTDVDGKLARVSKGAFYVAITRVRKGDDLFLTRFSPKFIHCNEEVERELKRLSDHAQHQVLRPFLYMPIFSSPDGNPTELKVSYLNVNGLLDADHILDLRADMNLMNSDIICISETKVSKDFPDIVISIDEFSVVERIDSVGQECSMGMALYKRASFKGELQVMGKSRSERKVEMISVLINGVHFLFAYVHPSATSDVFKLLVESGICCNIVMADFNVNTYGSNSSGRKKMAQLADAMSKTQVLDTPTHSMGGQLDHILVDKSFKFPC